VVFDELESVGIETELVQLAGTHPRGCNACMACRKNQDQRCVQTGDPMNEWIARMDGPVAGDASPQPVTATCGTLDAPHRGDSPGRQEESMKTLIQLVFDATDPDRLARFWSAALGYKLQDPPAGYDTWPAFLEAQGIPRSEWDSASAIVDPDGVGPRIYFQRVPEPKTAKNRMHMDINVGGGRETPTDERKLRIAAEVERLRILGATDERGAMDRDGEYWVRMNDPEGNEFCLQ